MTDPFSRVAQEETDFYSHWTFLSAGFGFLLWCAIIFILDSSIGLIEKLFLLAPLVIIPLGLRAVEPVDRMGHLPRLYKLAVIAQPFCATAAAISFIVPVGLLAGFLSFGWFWFTVLMALLGFWRFLPRGLCCPEETLIDAGLIYPAVGGAWLVASRLGIPFFGFSGIITILTAVHFHYAGFAAPIIAGMAGRTFLKKASFGYKLFLCAGSGIILGIPLLALGITFSPSLEVASAILLFVSLWLLAFLLLTAAVPRMPSLRYRLLLGISATSLIPAMVFALVYAYGEFTGHILIDIPRMAQLHGIANAVGFSLCGLLAFALSRPKSKAPLPGIPFSAFTCWTRIGPDYFHRIKAVASTDSRPQGLTDSMMEYKNSFFDPSQVHPEVRRFYEETNLYALIVYPDWKFGFHWAGKMYRWMADRIGQMGLPLTLERNERLIDSKILSLNDKIDGRKKARAWIRTYSGTDKAVYVAAYANHSDGTQTYMNIAFPLPGGNLTSILRLEPLKTFQATDGVLLTTLSSSEKKGDEGVYLVTPLLPIRLPINETIRVWPTGEGDVPPPKSKGIAEEIRLTARHDMWIFGVRFLTLDYYIYQGQSA